MDRQVNTPMSTAESQESQRLKVDTQGIKKKKREILKTKVKKYLMK